MKKISVIFLFIVASIKLLAVDVTVLDNTTLKFDSWKDNGHTEFVRQFIVPIEKDGVNLNTKIEFTVSGVNSNWGLRIKNRKTGAIFTTFTTLTGTSEPLVFDATNAESSIYIFEFYNTINNSIINVYFGNTTIPFNYYFVTERCKTGIFPGTAPVYNYKINWVDYWLNNHANPAQFKTYVEDALKFNWKKQIDEWDLCNGVLNNQPIDNGDDNKDNGNEVDLNIDGYDQISFPYRGIASSNAMNNIPSRNISIDYHSYKMIGNYKNYSSELSLFHSLIAHEFFHNVQYSHNLINYTPYEQMKWVFEGQATCIQAVIMKEYGITNNTQNEEFLPDRYYGGRTKEMLELLLNNKSGASGTQTPDGEGLFFTNLTKDIYPYGWADLWKYLFDTYKEKNGNLPDIKTRLKIIVESVKHVTNLATVKADLDNVLEVGGGTNNLTFDDLMNNFAEDFYFCHNATISNFIDENYNNFYTGIRNSVTSNIYASKNQILAGNGFGLFYDEYGFDGFGLNLNTYYGNQPPYYTSAGKQKLNISIDNPFQIQSREIFIENPLNGTRLTINNDINGDGNNTHVRAYIVDNAGAVVHSQTIDLTGQVSNFISFPAIDANCKLVLLFLRTDQPPAGQSRTGDLEIRFAPACPGNDAVFSVNHENIDAGTSVKFTSFSCSNVNYWHWVFEGGNPPEYEGQSPPYIYYPNEGDFDVSLTVSDGVSAPDSRTKLDYIKVRNTMATLAGIDFIYNVETGEFIGKSSAPNIYGWLWTFSNGTETGQIVKHQLPIPETISFVTLTINFSDGSSKSKTQRLIDCGYPYQD